MLVNKTFGMNLVNLECIKSGALYKINATFKDFDTNQSTTLVFLSARKVTDIGNFSLVMKIPSIEPAYPRKTFTFKPVTLISTATTGNVWANTIAMKDFDDDAAISVVFTSPWQVASCSNLSVSVTDEP